MQNRSFANAKEVIREVIEKTALIEEMGTYVNFCAYFQMLELAGN
jgi:hypothetical protein